PLQKKVGEYGDASREEKCKDMEVMENLHANSLSFFIHVCHGDVGAFPGGESKKKHEEEQQYTVAVSVPTNCHVLLHIYILVNLWLCLWIQVLLAAFGPGLDEIERQILTGDYVATWVDHIQHIHVVFS
ncbi:hypothetical protein ACJX0J_007831, partial [Zea mays]